MTAPAPLHPNTLAAHLRRRGFVRAAPVDCGPSRLAGFHFARQWRRSGCRTVTAEPGTVILCYRCLKYLCLDGVCFHRAELEKMIAALAPDFEVTEDLGSRVVVRRKGAES